MEIEPNRPDLAAVRGDLPTDAVVIDEIVLREDVVGADGSTIGEHIEIIDVVEIGGEGVVVIDDVTIVADDEGDVLIEETIATFDEAGDAIVETTRTIVDAEGDVMIEERVTAVDAAGDVVTFEEIIVLDADEIAGASVDERELATALRAELDDVERALERLDAGTYATCESCGDEIDDAVLAARPQARACAAHLLT